MIGFVTWPPFHTIIINKGGQVTKSIIVVKICYKLLYVIQVASLKRFLISNFLARYQSFWSHIPICNAASDWPCTFLHSRCFCLALDIHKLAQ